MRILRRIFAGLAAGVLSMLLAAGVYTETHHVPGQP